METAGAAGAAYAGADRIRGPEKSVKGGLRASRWTAVKYDRCGMETGMGQMGWRAGVGRGKDALGTAKGS